MAAMLLFATSPVRADLVVIQDSNGFPGSTESDTARQKVFIGKDKLRVLDERHGWALFVRLDQKVVREAQASERTYVEKPLSFYQKIRDDREKTRAAKVQEYKNLVQRADDKQKQEFKKDLEKMGLREDGETVARLESFPDDTKEVTLVVNNEKKTYKVEHYVVRENEGPAIFDVWVAPGLGRPESVFRFYQEIGTFSPAVVQKVMTLDGFPIDITAIVDDGNNKKTLKSRVFEVRDESLDAVEYDVPASWKLTEGRKEAGLAPVESCAICGKECRPDQGDGMRWHHPWNRKTYTVCSPEHRAEMIKRAAQEEQNRDKPEKK